MLQDGMLVSQVNIVQFAVRQNYFMTNYNLGFDDLWYSWVHFW